MEMVEDKLKDILIVIPAYNEEKNIQAVIEDLRRHGYNKILVIDDGSDDQTYNIANRLDVYLARHALNIGVGNASATGFEIARMLNSEILVTFDGDGQHDAADIAKLIDPIRQDQVDVVIGSRMLTKSDMPLRRVLYNKIANIITFILYGFSVSDTQSGLKAFNRKAYNLIEIETSGMEFCSEIIYKIKQENLRFKEIQVRTIYTDYSLSKGQNFLLGIKTLFRLILSRFSRR